MIWSTERSGSFQAKAARFLGITPRQIGYALHTSSIEVHRF
ncbi:helix-turn-helix domain-containing protein [Paraburkholderia phytofirmans]